MCESHNAAKKDNARRGGKLGITEEENHYIRRSSPSVRNRRRTTETPKLGPPMVLTLTGRSKIF